MLKRLAIGLAAACAFVAAQDSYDTIYNDIGSLPCVRLLNATGTIGCQSMDAATGVLFRTDTQDDIQQFASQGGLVSKYTVVMPYWLLTNANVDLLKSSHKLAAIIAVVNGTDPVYSPSARPTINISPDTTCPNCEFGLYSDNPNQYQWNPTGSGLLYSQFDFPIYALNTMDVRNTMSYNAVMQAANTNRFRGYNNFPLKALQFHAFMWAAQDAGTCLRKGWCTPVGGASVWATPSINITSTDNKPIVVISAAMDSRSLFHDLTMGVESSISSMVTLLAVAEALSRSSIPLDTMPNHILYTLFTAEAWGFSGSQRFVQDISTTIDCLKPNGASCTYPFYSDLDFERINPANIHAIIEAGQVGSLGPATPGTGSGPTLYAHIDNTQAAASTALLDQIVQVGSTVGNVTAAPNSTGTIQAANSDGVQRGLPPSSSMSFLKAQPQIPTVVVTDYQKEMSLLTSSDLDDSWDPVKTVNSIQLAASIISKTAWLQAQGVNNATMTPAQQQAIGSIQINGQLVSDLLYCLTQNYSCPLVNSYLNVTASPNPPTRLPHYTGTLYSQSQPFPIFAWSFLANMTRVQNATSPPVTGCSSNPLVVQCASDQYCVGDQCILTMTRYHDAFGVGIAMAEDNSYYIKDASKPVWVEATWDPIGLRLFDVTSPRSQKVELVVGVLLTALTIGLVVVSKRVIKKTLKTD
ncbi:nicastrin [Entomortierella parvispora]|uniref:Nicastrin n=1 Tax=Entomortierella parvispora TaxID=205924 RepID=A0A9P3HM20_9FUNG|nr:nicastrin [Entomortierella parvispora]